MRSDFATTETVSTAQLAAWAKRGDDAGRLARELLNTRARNADEHRCFICDEPFKAGQLVLSDVNEGLGHRACFGEDRDGYVQDIGSMEPLGPDDPIPAGEPYDPAEYFPEFAQMKTPPTAWAFERSWHTIQHTGNPAVYSDWRPELSWEKPEQTVTVRNLRPLYEGASR